jgi:hypothetical protein
VCIGASHFPLLRSARFLKTNNWTYFPLSRIEVVQQSQALQDDELTAGVATVTLNDPFLYCRIQTPARGRYCTHPECFDAAIFIEMNAQTPAFVCPICSVSFGTPNENLGLLDVSDVPGELFDFLGERPELSIHVGFSPIDYLVIDHHFSKMLSRVTEHHKTVDLDLSTGKWVIATIEDAISANTTPIKRNDRESSLLVLTDSEDSDEESSSVKPESGTAAPLPAPFTSQSVVTSVISGSRVVDLTMDSEDESPPNPEESYRLSVSNSQGHQSGEPSTSDASGLMAVQPEATPEMALASPNTHSRSLPLRIRFTISPQRATSAISATATALPQQLEIDPRANADQYPLDFSTSMIPEGYPEFNPSLPGQTSSCNPNRASSVPRISSELLHFPSPSKPPRARSLTADVPYRSASPVPMAQMFSMQPLSGHQFDRAMPPLAPLTSSDLLPTSAPLPLSTHVIRSPGQSPYTDAHVGPRNDSSIETYPCPTSSSYVGLQPSEDDRLPSLAMVAAAAIAGISEDPMMAYPGAINSMGSGSSPQLISYQRLPSNDGRLPPMSSILFEPPLPPHPFLEMRPNPLEPLLAGTLIYITFCSICCSWYLQVIQFCILIPCFLVL